MYFIFLSVYICHPEMSCYKKKKLDEYNTINCVYVFWFKLLFLKMTCSLWCLYRRSGCREPTAYITSSSADRCCTFTELLRLVGTLPQFAKPPMPCTRILNTRCCWSIHNPRCNIWILSSAHFFPPILWGEIPNPTTMKKSCVYNWGAAVLFCWRVEFVFCDQSGSWRQLRLFDCGTHSETQSELKHNSLSRRRKVRL